MVSTFLHFYCSFLIFVLYFFCIHCKQDCWLLPEQSTRDDENTKVKLHSVQQELFPNMLGLARMPLLLLLFFFFFFCLFFILCLPLSPSPSPLPRSYSFAIVHRSPRLHADRPNLSSSNFKTTYHHDEKMAINASAPACITPLVLHPLLLLLSFLSFSFLSFICFFGEVGWSGVMWVRCAA